MLALQEFGISDCSSNFTLCEVTVEVLSCVALSLKKLAYKLSCFCKSGEPGPSEAAARRANQPGRAHWTGLQVLH